MVRASLLDDDTIPCDMIECDDAWQAITAETVYHEKDFHSQPFSRQIRGWVHLFWFLVAFYAAANWYDHYLTNGTLYAPQSWYLLHLTYRDMWGLFKYDVFLIGYTFLSVPLQIIFAKGIVGSHNWGAWLIRHLFALSPIAIAVKICFSKDWVGFQTATFLMHSCVLFMKIHSYLQVNLELHDLSMEKRRKPGPYPANLTLWNFFDFLLVPTLIYQPSYPRAKRIRWLFVFNRVLGALVIVTMMYTIIESYLLPPLKAVREDSYLTTLAHMLLPLSLNILLCFFLVFEYILNFFAEITRFADRRFYDDWWNSLDYAEFARKWNVPVHKFFQTHVYLACRIKLGWSKTASAFWTFLFSSILHELIMSMSAKRLRYEFFCAQMLQIPLIWLWGRFGLTRFSKAANIFFLMGTFLGSTALIIIYAGHATHSYQD